MHRLQDMSTQDARSLTAFAVPATLRKTSIPRIASLPQSKRLVTLLA
jgi:hypothetical protein